MIENNMSYEGFKEYFWEQLKNTLSEGIELQEQNCLKNNDLQVEMLTCKEEGFGQESSMIFIVNRG